MDTYEKKALVAESVEMMRASIGRPRFRAMIRRRVRRAIHDALLGKMAELVDLADKLEE